MPDLLAVALIIVGALMIAGFGRRLLDLIFPQTPEIEPAEPEPAVDMKRLQEIAAVPMEKIIEAAYWRALHPDEPEPEVLANLDPSAWTTKPAALPGPLPELDDNDLIHKYGGPALVSGGRTGFSSGGLLQPGVIVVPQGLATDQFRRELLLKITGGRSAVIEAPMEWKPIPVAARPNPYADCQHEDAERENVVAAGSDIPVRTFVTSCRECDLARLKARLRKAADEVKELAATWPIDAGGCCTVTPNQRRQYEKAMADAQEIKRRIYALERP